MPFPHAQKKVYHFIEQKTVELQVIMKISYALPLFWMARAAALSCDNGLTVDFACAKCGQILECYVDYDPSVPDSHAVINDYLALSAFCDGFQTTCGGQQCAMTQGLHLHAASSTMSCPVLGSFQCHGGANKGAPASLSNWATYQLALGCANDSETWDIQSLQCSDKCDSGGTCDCQYGSETFCANCLGSNGDFIATTSPSKAPISTEAPTKAFVPTLAPTTTQTPSISPTVVTPKAPTDPPFTSEPIFLPTAGPFTFKAPTVQLVTHAPISTVQPVTSTPTHSPSVHPVTNAPTNNPTVPPPVTSAPTQSPSVHPVTNAPTYNPTVKHVSDAPFLRTAPPTQETTVSTTLTRTALPTSTPTPMPTSRLALLPVDTRTTKIPGAPVTRNIGCVTGDPHVYTFDGLKYDCHGEGEFILAKSTSTAREIQMRFEHMTTDRALTVGKAVAMRDEGDMPIVQVSIASLNTSRGFDMGDKDGCGRVQLYVDGVLRDLSEGSGQDDKVVITHKGTDIWVRYVESEMMVKVRYHRCRLNVCLHLPDTDHTVGVLGTATNSIEDDWTTLDGSILDVPESLSERLRKPAYDYCTQNFCIRDDEESLFVYGEEGFDCSYYNKCDLPFSNTIETYLLDVPQWILDVCKGELQCIIDVQNGDEQDAIAVRDTLAEYATICNPSGGECDESPCCSGECVDQGGFAGKTCDGNSTCSPEFGNCELTDCCGDLTCTAVNDGTAMCVDQRELMDEWMSCALRNCSSGLVCLDNQRGGKQCRRLHQCAEKWDDCSMVTCCGQGEMKCLSNGFGGKHCVETADCYDKQGMDCSDYPCCDGLTCVIEEGRSACKKLPKYATLGESCAYIPCREDFFPPLDCVETLDGDDQTSMRCQERPANAEILVFNDINSNGVKDFGEPTVSGVVLRLIRNDDKSILLDRGQVTTDEDGLAAFEGLPRGVSLRVEVVKAPSGAVRTLNNQGENDLIDSDLLDDGTSNPFFVKWEDVWTKTALGFRMPADIEIFCFNDSNNNGIHDGNEGGIEGVELRLITPSDSLGLPEQGNGGNAHKNLVTNELGVVMFTKVPQNVQLRAQVVGAPLGAVVADSRVGLNKTVDSDLRSDGTSFSFMLKVGSTHTSLDLAYRMPETLRVRVWNDANEDGILNNGETGLQGVGVRLVNDKGSVNLVDHGGNSHLELFTNELGETIFTNVPVDEKVRVKVTQPPKGAIQTRTTSGSTADGKIYSKLERGGLSGLFSIDESGSEIALGYRMAGSVTIRVWDDVDGNGIQDYGENGLSGVSVRLIKDEDRRPLSQQDVDGGNAYSELTTALDGFVSFNNVPRGIPLRVYVTNAPTGAIRTIHNAGISPVVDSDLGSNGLSDRFLLLGNTTEEIDLGFRAPCDVKIRVWGDNNSNGIQDEGEHGISGVKLRLVKEKDGSFYQGECEAETSGIEKIGEGNCREEVVTDENGHALFTSVPKSVSFRAKVLNAPKGLKRTVHNKGSDSRVDSDLGNGGLTDAFHLGKFSEAVFDDLDIGFVLPQKVLIRVWDDSNHNGQQDVNERGVEGVRLRLIRAIDHSLITQDYGGNAHEELETDSNGVVQYFGVPIHEHLRVKVVNAPAGAIRTNINEGGDEAVDSDLRSDGTTVSFSLKSFGFKSFDKIDIGYRLPSDLKVRVWDDVNGNGIQDGEHEHGIQGVKLRLINDKTKGFLTNIGGGSNAHTEVISDSDGYATFQKVPKGIDFRVKVTNAPGGSIRTGHNIGGSNERDSDFGDDMISDKINLSSFASPIFESLDLGLKMPKTMVVRVWNDLNRDGVQNDNEGGIPNVLLCIIGNVGREDLPDQSNGGNAHTVVSTDSLGRATFTGVPQGIRMRIKVVQPPKNARVTKKKAASDHHFDSDMNPSGISDSFKLPNDTTELFDTIDAGYYFNDGFGINCLVP